MNIALMKWMNKKTKKQLIDIVYELHLENLELKKALNRSGLDEE